MRPFARSPQTAEEGPGPNGPPPRRTPASRPQVVPSSAAQGPEGDGRTHLRDHLAEAGHDVGAFGFLVVGKDPRQDDDQGKHGAQVHLGRKRASGQVFPPVGDQVLGLGLQGRPEQQQVCPGMIYRPQNCPSYRWNSGMSNRCSRRLMSCNNQYHPVLERFCHPSEAPCAHWSVPVPTAALVTTSLLGLQDRPVLAASAPSCGRHAGLSHCVSGCSRPRSRYRGSIRLRGARTPKHAARTGKCSSARSLVSVSHLCARCPRESVASGRCSVSQLFPRAVQGGVRGTPVLTHPGLYLCSWFCPPTPHTPATGPNQARDPRASHCRGTRTCRRSIESRRRSSTGQRPPTGGWKSPPPSASGT